MKKILFILFLSIIITGCSNNNFGATEVDEEIVNAHEFEKLYKEIEKKYKHIKKYEKNDAKYLINEYEKSSGEVGYQIVKDDGATIESVCLGVECDGKNYIKIVEVDIASTTKK